MIITVDGIQQDVRKQKEVKQNQILEFFNFPYPVRIHSKPFLEENMLKTRLFQMMGLLVVLSLVLAACAP